MMPTPTRNELSRRRLLLTGCAAVVLCAGSAAAGVEAARALVENVVGEIGAVLEANRPRDWKIGQIERILTDNSNMDAISRRALGPAARSAGSAQLATYRSAFQGYLARKYALRFDEFFKASVTVTGAKPWKSHFQVLAEVEIPSRADLNVVFLVSNRSGQPLILDIIIAGVSLLKTEALEIRALLERSRGDLDRLTASLQSLR